MLSLLFIEFANSITNHYNSRFYMTNDLPRVVESSGNKLVDTSAVWIPEGLIDGVVLPGSYLILIKSLFSLTNCFLYFITFTQTCRISDRS